MSPPAPTDPCLDTVDTVLIDGANGVCRRPLPRTDALAPGTVALLVGAFLVAAVVLVAGSPRARTRAAVVVLLALAFALPGLWAVFTRRADAPAHLAASARAVERLVGPVERYAAARGGCVEVQNRGCEACEPVLRFARPAARPCGVNRGRVAVGPGALTSGCALRDGELRCGAVP